MLTGAPIYGDDLPFWLDIEGQIDTPFMDGGQYDDTYIIRNVRTHIHDTGPAPEDDWYRWFGDTVDFSELDSTERLQVRLLDADSDEPIGDLVFKGVEHILHDDSWFTVEADFIYRYIGSYDYGLDVIGNGVGNRLHGGDAVDILLGEGGGDGLYGGANDDALYGGPGRDFLNGQHGNDTIYGGPGADRMEGSMGRDRLFGGKDADTIDGGQGNDFIDGGSGDDEIEGGDGDDVIQTASGRNTIKGNDGDDRILGGKGKDNIDGGFGDDVLSGRAGDDTIRGHVNNDRLMGNGGDDMLFGGLGRDVLIGGLGEDYLACEFGNDVLTGGLGGQNGDGMTDTFVFEAHRFKSAVGYDTILDFEVGIDKLVLKGFGYDGDFDAFLADATDHPKGVLITLNPRDSVLLVGVDAAELTAGMVDLA